MVKKIVKCPNPKCGQTIVLNTDKHRHRKKLCPKCRAVVDNQSPKARILSVFQRKKKERKEKARKRFIDGLLARKMSWRQIEKRLSKVFEWEEE